MLQFTVLTSALVAVALSSSDPVVAICGDRCYAWDALQDQCEEQKGCWGLNGGEYGVRDENCLSECRLVAAPCRQACRVAFNFCQSQCLVDQPDFEACFFTCYENKFQKTLPPLPTQVPA